MTGGGGMAELIASAGDPPWACRDWDGLEHEAVEALARRQLAYPDLVAARKLDPDWAAADIAAWVTIRDDWMWVNSRFGEEGCRAGRDTLAARIDAVDTALERWATANHQRRFDDAANLQGHRLIAMRWHLLRERTYYPNDIAFMHTVHGCADLNHEVRRRQRAEGVLPTDAKGASVPPRPMDMPASSVAPARPVTAPPGLTAPTRDLFGAQHDRRAA